MHHQNLQTNKPKEIRSLLIELIEFIRKLDDYFIDHGTLPPSGISIHMVGKVLERSLALAVKDELSLEEQAELARVSNLMDSIYKNLEDAAINAGKVLKRSLELAAKDNLSLEEQADLAKISSLMAPIHQTLEDAAIQVRKVLQPSLELAAKDNLSREERAGLAMMLSNLLAPIRKTLEDEALVDAATKADSEVDKWMDEGKLDVLISDEVEPKARLHIKILTSNIQDANSLLNVLLDELGFVIKPYQIIQRDHPPLDVGENINLEEPDTISTEDISNQLNTQLKTSIEDHGEFTENSQITIQATNPLSNPVPEKQSETLTQTPLVKISGEDRINSISNKKSSSSFLSSPAVIVHTEVTSPDDDDRTE